MAGLSCGEVSPISWEILRARADDFLAIDEALVAPCMQMLAGAEASSEKIVAGESGVAGLAGLLAAVERSEVRAALDLHGNSRVLLIGSEGATDPDIYAALVGQRPEIVPTAPESGRQSVRKCALIAPAVVNQTSSPAFS